MPPDVMIFENFHEGILLMREGFTSFVTLFAKADQHGSWEFAATNQFTVEVQLPTSRRGPVMTELKMVKVDFR